MATSTFKTGPPPAWVEWESAELEAPVEIGHESGGQIFILFDTQVNTAKAEACVHIVKQITAQAGIQSGANLEFTWDPSFQELVMHQITIQRGTNRMDRLDPAKFKLIQQETDLSRQLYNGALSAVLFLDDVRVGDWIEYAYTVRGENPSLKGRYSDTFGLGWAMPVKQRHIRVLWPEGRGLNLRTHGTSAEPEVHLHNGIKEFIWNLHALPAVAVEDQVPSWFPAYPWIQISEFTNWSEVATWAAALYVTTNLDAPELKETVASLRRPGGTVEERVQGVLDFAQNEIRYLGIEFGPNSYHPTDPVTVLRRRFGDCKDKAFLLCTLLQSLGYEATPLLVATGLRHTLPDFLPAPHDFDHVIVRVEAAGVTYWLDPTRTYQHGPLTQRFLPQYGFGLLVRAGETELTSIPDSNASNPETVTSEIFHLGGQKAPAQLSVTSTFNGFDAEWMRAVLAGGGPERLAKSYLNDYAQRYPGILPTGPLVIEDSTNYETFTITHTYSISNFWVLSADKQRYSCQFYPLGIHTWIAKPMTAIRSMPMELSFPRRRSVHTKIELPTVFKLSNFTNTITGPAAELQVSRSFRGQTVWLNYEYNALTNFVPVSLAAEHLGSLDQMENKLTYVLDWQNMGGVRSQFNWPIFLLAIFYTGALATGAGLLCRRQSRMTVTGEGPLALVDASLKGLGGWLVLVGIGLVLGPIQRLNSLIHSAGAFSLWQWHAVTNPGGVSYNPAWRFLLSFELLGQITILVVNFFAMVLFFQKRRMFPRWFIALWVCIAIFIVGDLIGVQFVKTSPTISQDSPRSFLQIVIVFAIWIPYMCKSRRVKATFVR